MSYRIKMLGNIYLFETLTGMYNFSYLIFFLLSQNGFVSATPSLAMCVMMIAGGHLSHYLHAKRGFSTTNTRKISAAVGRLKGQSLNGSDTKRNSHCRREWIMYANTNVTFVMLWKCSWTSVWVYCTNKVKMQQRFKCTIMYCIDCFSFMQAFPHIYLCFWFVMLTY